MERGVTASQAQYGAFAEGQDMRAERQSRKTSLNEIDDLCDMTLETAEGSGKRVIEARGFPRRSALRQVTCPSFRIFPFASSVAIVWVLSVRTAPANPP